MRPSLMAAPTRVEEIDLATDMDIQRVLGVLPRW
jgi:hypothetical protein